MYSFGLLVYQLMHGRTPHWNAVNLGASSVVVTATVIVLGRSQRGPLSRAAFQTLSWMLTAAFIRTQTRPAIEFVSGEEGLRPESYHFVFSFTALLYKFIQKYANAPGLHWGAKGTWRYAACCTLYVRRCPLVLVQRQSIELPATTVGERRRRRALRRHKERLWTVSLTSYHKCCCSVAFKPNGLGPIPHLAIQAWQKRHLALRGRVSCRVPAVPVRWVRCCSCSRMALPSRDPGTRLQGAAEWFYHSRQAGNPRKGDQPKDWRAPTQGTAPFRRYPLSGMF